MVRDFGTYRKLFDHPTPDFERLPFRVRCFAAEMIRRGDRLGRIVPLRRDADDVTDVTPSQFAALVDDVAFHVRSTGTEDVEFIREALPMLLEDTYFVFRSGWLTMRNFAEAQRSESADRMARKRDRDSGKTSVTVTSRPSQPSPGMVGLVSAAAAPDLDRGSPEGGATERLNAGGSVGATAPEIAKSVNLANRCPEDVFGAQAVRVITAGPPTPAVNVVSATGQTEARRILPPGNLAQALEMPIQERSILARDRPDVAQWIEPHRWPEVEAVAAALARETGQRRPKLGATRDRGVEAVVALYADGWTQAELEQAVAAVVKSDWWRKEPRDLSSLSPVVVRKALAGKAPDPNRVSVDRREREERRKAEEAHAGRVPMPEGTMARIGKRMPPAAPVRRLTQAELDAELERQSKGAP